MTRNNSCINGAIFTLLLLSLLCSIAFSQTDNPDQNNDQWQDNPWGYTVTRDLSETPLGNYSDWISDHPVQPFSVTGFASVLAADKSRAGGEIAIIVNSGILSSIQTSLDQYQLDIAAEGFTSTIYSMTGGTPDSLRTFLQSLYATSLTGALLIGDLPVAWYEADCWDPVDHEQFPTDLFYMDLDGNWDDMDVDGQYDYHTGDLGPEIYVGRLTASPLTYNSANEISLLENYFDKIHRYRTGQLIFEDRGLAYIDDDWSNSGWQNDLGRAYDSVVAVYDDYTTTASNYQSHFPASYEYVLLCAHSSPNLHQFLTPSSNYSTMWYNTIVDYQPNVGFYNLFNCSGSRFTTENYLGGWYIFQDSRGLGSVGSTKTGSMLSFDYYYNSWAAGNSFGKAFLDWFEQVSSDGFADWEICWFYGMTLCGDPTLTPSGYTLPRITTTELTNAMLNEGYSVSIQAEGGIPPYTWEVVTGTCPDGITIDETTGVLSGTPCVIGDFDFMVRIDDANIPSYAAVMNYDMTVNYICGDANGDMSVNVADAVTIISYIFAFGDVAYPVQASDANCDGSTNVGDAIHIVNHVFRSGPEACCQ